MRSLRAQRPARRRDPAPSRWGYRYQRLMLTPGVRKLFKVGLPVLVVSAAFAGWYAKDSNRQMVADTYASTVSNFQSREEFMVKVMAIDGADERLAEDIRMILPLEFPLSSFDLDLEEMRLTVAAIPAVAEAALRVRPGGVLQFSVTQRRPVAVFRDADGLRLLDRDGVLIATLNARADRPDLPLITGDGSRELLEEGLAIYQVAGPIRSRMRAVVRMGERRWDVVLDRDQRILLPTGDPISAFQRVIALNDVQDLLDRDIAVVDMRNATRPTIRLNEQAVAHIRNTSGADAGTNN